MLISIIAIILILALTTGFVYVIIKSLKKGEIEVPATLWFPYVMWKANRKKDKGDYWVWLVIMMIVTAFFLFVSIASILGLLFA